MSDKETTRNETPWRARGFKKPFSGSKNYTYQEFIDANKSNVLKLNLRQRELQCGAAFAKRDYKNEELERSELRKALVSAWQTNVRRWKQRKNYNRTVVSMFQTGVNALQRQGGKNGFTGKCYGCGGNHKLADCPNRNKGSFCFADGADHFGRMRALEEPHQLLYKYTARS